MATTLGSITRTGSRKYGESLNVLTFPTHERFQSGLSSTNAVYYLFHSPHVKTWNRTYSNLPANHVLLNPSRGERQLPPDVDFDVVLSQNKFGQYQIASQFARQFHLPMISLEHTLTVPQWGAAQRESVRKMRGDINLFISEFSVANWGFSMDDPTVRVIEHGVDTKTFSPNEMLCDRKPHLLSVVNDWKNRDWACGYRLWEEVSKGLQTSVVGDTPGLSEPAKSVPDLVMKYRSSRVFLNTSLVSPIPTALLEAMACGCSVISSATCSIPGIIENGVNGFISNDPAELRSYCQLLLKDEDLAKRLGEQARQTILKRFSMKRFVAEWDCLLREAAEITYRRF